MKILKTILIAFGIVTALSTPCLAVEYFLRADVTTKTMPDGTVIPMWGFALDSAFGALDGNVTVPGPLLTVPSGDPELIIHLDNNLSVPVSIVINGQIAVMTPVRNTDGRVRSFTHETEPNNAAPVDYVWTNFQEGAYAYQSGTHIAVQIQMGLYGGVVKDFDVDEAYNGVTYDISIPLFFSEIDPALHTAVDTNNYGPGLAMTSTIGYAPKYFLINGQSFGPNSLALAAGNPDDTVLLRLFNMGLETRCPLLQDGYMTLVAEDGQAYQYPKEQYVALLAAGKTIDALATFSADGAYPIYDRRLGLTNSQATGGGMRAYLKVGTTNIGPKIFSVTATPSSLVDVQTSQLQVIAGDLDAGPSPLSYNWIVPAGAGSVSDATIANPVYTPPDINATQTYRLTVEVSDGLNTVSPTVDVTVSPAVPILVKSSTVAAGKRTIPVIPGINYRDRISISGQTAITADDFNNASIIEVTIDSVNMVNPLVMRFPINNRTLRNGNYSYSGTTNGVRRIFRYNASTGKLTFSASKVDLSGLSCPISATIKVGDNFTGYAELSEEIVNGPRRPVPINLMMGVENSLRVDRFQVRRGTTSDSMSVRGGFVVQNSDVNMVNSNFVVTLGTQTFTVPAGSFVAVRNGFICRNVILPDGSIVTANFNFRTSVFTLGIRTPEITANPGAVNFGIEFADFIKETMVNIN